MGEDPWAMSEVTNVLMGGKWAGQGVEWKAGGYHGSRDRWALGCEAEGQGLRTAARS